MIKKIAFKNFKLFKQKQELELMPITILIGKNNTGKSAVLKLMPLLESSLSGRFNEPINFQNIEVTIADYPKELIYGKANRDLEFEIFNEKTLKINLFAEDHVFKIESWNYDGLELFQEDDCYIDKDGTQLIADFNGFKLNSLKKKDGSNFETHYKQIEESELFTDFISAIRDEAQSNYPFEGKSYEKSGIRGTHLYQFLIEDSQTTDKKYFTAISDWIKDKFEGWELKVEYDGYRKDLPALIFLEKDNLKINLSQTGMGISQVLPLVIRAYKPCEKETLIIIEEPESHLHPYAHALIGQLFYESITSDQNKKYLIETHSQNFILRLRRLIAEGKLSHNDIKIYYVDYDENLNASELKEIKVDEKGGVEWWPEGVFGEAVIEARKIYNAQLNDLKNVGRDN